MCDVYLERDGATYTVSVKGHATGSPAMCAAVSALVCTLRGWLANTDIVEVYASQTESGDSLLKWSGGSDEIWLFLAVGFLQLEGADPDRLRVSVVEI